MAKTLWLLLENGAVDSKFELRKLPRCKKIQHYRSHRPADYRRTCRAAEQRAQEFGSLYFKRSKYVKKYVQMSRKSLLEPKQKNVHAIYCRYLKL